MKTFSIKEAIKFGWETTKAHLGFAAGTTLIYGILTSLPNTENRTEDFTPLSVILSIAAFIVIIIVQIGYFKVYLQLHDGEKPALMDLFSNYRLFWKYLGAYILYELRVLVGFILLIVPGLIWAFKFMFAPLLAIDKGMGPMEAMRESARMTEGHKMHLFQFSLVAALVVAAGFVALFVGALVSIPVATIAYMHVYRKLSEPVAEEVPVPDAPVQDTPVSEPVISA